jgi:small subunit ribosomal protein S9
MVTKKTKIEKEDVKKEKEEKTEKTSRYFYAVGRRKTAIAKIKLYPSGEAQNIFTVNGKKMEEYFPLGRLSESAGSPLSLAGENKFKAEIKVIGGGVNSQAEAIRLGISRALVLFDANFKKSLRDKGYLTRDSRKVERKKPGLKKARRAPQWAKR